MFYLRKIFSCASAISLLSLTACWVAPGADNPQTSGWNHMDYAALTCDPAKPPSTCPPLHPDKTVVASNTRGPGGTATVPNNNADTHSLSDYHNAETQESQSDVQHSAAQNNNGFSAASNNSGAYGYYSDSFPGTENQADIQKSADQNNNGFSGASNNHGDYGYFGGHK